MNQPERKRNTGFDVLKFLCAFLVICIHTDYYGKEFVVPIARAAVPVFFMITGYFHATILQSGKQSHQLRKIGLITLLANLLYMLWEMLTGPGSIADTLHSWWDAEVWLRFLLLNESPFRSHLWYLGALLYVLVIVEKANKRGLRGKLYRLIPVLLMCNLVLGNYAGLLLGKEIPLEFSRNYLFLGLPCFLLGDLLYRNRDAKQMSNLRLTVLLLSAVILTYAEKSLLCHTGTYGNQDFFLGTIFVSYSLFCLVRNNPQVFEHRFLKRVGRWGRELSLGLYIFNVIIRTVVMKGIGIAAVQLPWLQKLSDHIAPLIMLLATSCTAWIMLLGWRKIKCCFRRSPN